MTAHPGGAAWLPRRDPETCEPGAGYERVGVGFEEGVWLVARVSPALALSLVRDAQAGLDRLAERLAAVPPPVRVQVPVPDQEAT